MKNANILVRLFLALNSVISSAGDCLESGVNHVLNPNNTTQVSVSKRTDDKGKQGVLVKYECFDRDGIAETRLYVNDRLFVRQGMESYKSSSGHYPEAMSGGHDLKDSGLKNGKNVLRYEVQDRFGNVNENSVEFDR